MSRGRENTSMAALKSYFEELWDSSNCRIYEPGKRTRSSGERRSLTEWYRRVRNLYPEACETVDYEAETLAAGRVTYLSNSMDAGIRKPELFSMLKTLMAGQNEVLIQTPYIVCSSDMYEGLSEIADTTEKFEIITNAVESGANPWGCTDYLNQKDNILKTGAVVYEYLGEHSSHHKTILINDRISIVGSYNLDMRSTYLDTEMMLVVDSPELNRELKVVAEEEKSSSRRAEEDEPDQYGENYSAVELTEKKEIYYSILRVVCRPIRHML